MESGTSIQGWEEGSARTMGQQSPPVPDPPLPIHPVPVLPNICQLFTKMTNGNVLGINNIVNWGWGLRRCWQWKAQHRTEGKETEWHNRRQGRLNLGKVGNWVSQAYNTDGEKQAWEDKCRQAGRLSLFHVCLGFQSRLVMAG